MMIMVMMILTIKAGMSMMYDDDYSDGDDIDDDDDIDNTCIDDDYDCVGD